MVTGLGGAASAFAGDIDGDGDQDVLGVADALIRLPGGEIAVAARVSSSPTLPLLLVSSQMAQKMMYYRWFLPTTVLPLIRSLELAYWNLDLLAADCLTPRTSVQVNANLAALRVRLDDGDGVFETDGSDVQVGIVSSGSFSLDGSGTQQVAFTNNDANVQIGGTSSKTYWVSLQAPVAQGQLDICVRVDPDADMLVEGKTPDFSVSIQDSTATMTTNMPTAVSLQSFTAT